MADLVPAAGDDLTSRPFGRTSNSLTLVASGSTWRLGELGSFESAVLKTDLAFCRRLCEKLYLKAETQQVDRILEQFSRRYWENNPKAVYGSAGVLLCRPPWRDPG